MKKIDKLSSIIKKLHQGVPVEEVKKEFQALASDVSAYEISQMEEQLIAEGLEPLKIKKLCDIHAEIFQDSLNKNEIPGVPPGHPIHNYMLENREIERIIERIDYLLSNIDGKLSKLKEQKHNLVSIFEKLANIDIHYSRKENQLFPMIEAKGITGPSQVMWAIHDDIRKYIKKILMVLQEEIKEEILEDILKVKNAVSKMITKEETILFPMAFEKISPSEWYEILKGEKEIGYAFSIPIVKWKPAEVQEKIETNNELKSLKTSGHTGVDLHLDTGILSADIVNLILKNLPVEISFVNADNKVAYYSNTPERIFPRSPGIIGREVQKCHPPKSVHIVEKIVSSFRDGSRDNADFLINMNGRYIYIRYFAVRDENGQYMGTLEVTQDITEIKKLEKEKRILDWE